MTVLYGVSTPLNTTQPLAQLIRVRRIKEIKGGTLLKGQMVEVKKSI